MLKLAPSLAMGWILGTALQLQQEDIWTVQRISASALFSLALLVCAWALSKLGPTKSFLCGNKSALFKGLQHLSLFVASMALALSFINVRCLLQDHRQLVRDIEGRDISLTGVVASLPVQSAMGVRFKFQVQSARLLDSQRAVHLPAEVDLNWYDREGGSMGESRAWADLNPGDTWQFVVRFKVPHGLRNPGGFDEELWLWENGVMATGTIRVSKRDTAPQKL